VEVPLESSLGGNAILTAQPIRVPQLGSSKMSLVLTLFVVGFLIFSAVSIVPALFAKYQLQDAIETESRFAVIDRKGENDIREDVWKKMQELDIPATKDAIRVSVAQRDVSITVDYSVPVDLKIYQFNLEFHPHADNHTL
jgi:hypothetical protein